MDAHTHVREEKHVKNYCWPDMQDMPFKYPYIELDKDYMQETQ